MVRTSILAVAFLGALTLGCLANRPALTCPRQGGPAWTQVDTRHFVVKTDRPVEDAKAIAIDVETSRAALLAAMGAPPDEQATRVEVVVLERKLDFRTIMNKPLSGVYIGQLRGDVELQPVIMMVGGLDYLTRATLQHELVHQILRRRTGHLPWWIDEGLAELYSTMRLEDGRIIVGEPPQDVGIWELGYTLTDVSFKIPKVWIPAAQAPSLDELLRADRFTVEATGQVGAHYAASWKMMHALRGHTDPRLAPRFKAMLSAIMGGADGSAAFARAYKGILMSEISDRYVKLLTDDRDYSRAMPFEPPKDIEPVVSAIPDDQVHALWARLEASFSERQMSPEEEIERGLAETVGSIHLVHARASLKIRTGDRAGVRDDIDELLKANPADPRYMLLDLLEAAEALRPAKGEAPKAADVPRDLGPKVERLMLVAATPAQRTFTALMLLRLGRTADALALARKAATADPSCAACFAVLATVLYQDGRLDEARSAAERAVALTPEGSSLDELRKLFAQIEEARTPRNATNGEDGSPR